MWIRLEQKRRAGYVFWLSLIHIYQNRVQGYHIIQSFRPGEVTPEQAHEIGCEFARRFLAGRYEAVIGTHLDKAHPHNHIVFNACSYADGRMFRNNFNDYYNGYYGFIYPGLGLV